jgi:hypothetical protein
MRKVYWMVIGIILLTTLACGLGGPAAQPKATIAPLTPGSDLTAVDLCAAIPVEDIEAVMGRKLTSQPERFKYYDAPGSSGCSYDAGSDSKGNAYYGYVVLTPVEVYDNQPLYQNADVSGIGQSAYFNNGADTRQLWVRVDDQVAFVVAFGDQPNEDGAMEIAHLLVEAIK